MEIKNNIGKLFYKDYYDEVDFGKVMFDNQDKNNDLQIDKTIKNSPLVKIEKPIRERMDTILATVQYPGLVTGVGLSHDAKVGYKLGMHFDYTHGMPIVYGSSVKGVLKTYFKEFYECNPDVDDLIEDIFSGKVRNTEKDKYDDKGKLLKGYDNKSIYKRDIFFDAVIVSAPKGNGTEGFLEDDSITPHSGLLSNPKPLKMLKIAPGCKMEFRFKLNDHKVNGREYTKEEILKIFKDILGTVGVGAKTNVGYGQLKIES